ncbi:MAG: tetratricopeptide repeat protein [Acidobacteriota bacterium]
MVRCSALVACLVTFAATAAAEPEPTPKQKAKASELVKQAIAKSQSGDHEAAIDLYNQAYMIFPQPLLLSNVASEYAGMGKKVEAVKYFCKYLTDDPNGNNASYASAQARSLQIELGNEPDDKDPCKTKPKAAPPPPPPPPPPNGGGAGEPAGGGVTGTLGIEKAEPETPHGSHALEYTGLAVGIVGLAAVGAGVYYGLQAKDISDQITNHDPMTMWPTNIKQMEADGQSDQNKQIAFMIVGGVATTTGVVMAIIGKSHASQPEHVSLRPVATPSSVGLAIGGGF